jgi:PAS domain S-box-containing protein
MLKLWKLLQRWVPVDHQAKDKKRESPRQNANHALMTERLRQSEERLQVLIESIQDYAIYILDPNGFVISWNSGAQRIKGYSADEIIGKHFSRFYTPNDLRINKPTQNLEHAATKGRYEDESLRMRKDGSIFWANVLITAIRDPSGNLTGFAKMVRDITERKASEQRLHETERLATLGTTAAVFAHEIANPLNGISGSLQIVSDLLDDADYHNPILRETIHGANQEIKRLASLLRNYRSFARPQTLDFHASNLHQLVEQVLAPNIQNYKNSGINVTLEFDENLPLVELDQEKIKQVVLNLCKNAIEAMPKGGSLTVRGYRSSGYVVLEVSDIGHGIPEGFNPFQIFKTTKPEGTGLGLSIVQQIVSDHHGSVDYVSELGKGATFWVSLPVRAPT